ncbi:hypothetical protein V6N13_089610 [Hibiscus sabdariffa]
MKYEINVFELGFKDETFDPVFRNGKLKEHASNFKMGVDSQSESSSESDKNSHPVDDQCNVTVEVDALNAMNVGKDDNISCDRLREDMDRHIGENDILGNISRESSLRKVVIQDFLHGEEKNEQPSGFVRKTTAELSSWAYEVSSSAQEARETVPLSGSKATKPTDGLVLGSSRALKDVWNMGFNPPKGTDVVNNNDWAGVVNESMGIK